MNSETKKVYGKLTEIMSDSETGVQKMSFDPVFGSKVELIYDSGSKGRIPEVGVFVNVYYEEVEGILRVVEIEGGPAEESEPVEIVPEKAPEPPKPPTGKLWTIKGEITSTSISGDPGKQTGSLNIMLQDGELMLLYSFSSLGEIPAVGETARVVIEDSKLPRVVEIRSAGVDDFIDGPTYTKIPEEPGDLRWPKACMSCGETQWSELKKLRPDTWEKFVDHKSTQWRKVLAEAGKGVILGGVLGAAEMVLKSQERMRGRSIYATLPITAYLCKVCHHRKRSYRDFMTIDLEDGSRKYSLTFTNEVYAKYFWEHNDEPLAVFVMR